MLIGPVLFAHWGIRTKIRKERKQALIIFATWVPTMIFGLAVNIILPSVGMTTPAVAYLGIVIWIGGWIDNTEIRWNRIGNDHFPNACGNDGGEISLESEEGQGATFWFDLVFRKQPLPDEPQSKHQVIFQELKILIVDDNTNNRFILREYLNPWECHIADAGPAGKLVTQHTIKEKHTGRL